MIFISHRGNIFGKNEERENDPNYIWEALHSGYQVEIDVWYDKGWWLGHDEPQYKINRRDLLHFWCHAKNRESLERMRLKKIIHCFWHEKDDYTLTSRGYIWVHSNKPIVKGSICVMPEKGISGNIKICGGICSDNISQYKQML